MERETRMKDNRRRSTENRLSKLSRNEADRREKRRVATTTKKNCRHEKNFMHKMSTTFV